MKQSLKREEAALERMDRLSTDASDLEIAEAMAEYYIAVANRRRIRLSIFHDVRKRTTEPPCPVEYDWQHKNTVGITTADEGRARDWAIRAMILGYAVFCRYGGAGYFTGSRGSI